MTQDAAAPLILTLQLDDRSQSWFDAQRRAYFPPERNVLAAHLTLFHHLPGQEIDTIHQQLATISGSQTTFSLQVTEPWMMGRGVAYRLHSPELQAMHAALARQWQDWLTPQDRQTLRPHVTVQNKVPSEQARALHEQLTARFKPFEATATGLTLWHYRGGPWEFAQAFPFNNERGQEAEPSVAVASGSLRRTLVHSRDKRKTT